MQTRNGQKKYATSLRAERPLEKVYATAQDGRKLQIMKICSRNVGLKFLLQAFQLF
jgi:hypothetical protein